MSQWLAPSVINDVVFQHLYKYIWKSRRCLSKLDVQSLEDATWPVKWTQTYSITSAININEATITWYCAALIHDCLNPGKKTDWSSSKFVFLVKNFHEWSRFVFQKLKWQTDGQILAGKSCGHTLCPWPFAASLCWVWLHSGSLHPPNCPSYSGGGQALKGEHNANST